VTTGDPRDFAAHWHPALRDAIRCWKDDAELGDLHRKLSAHTDEMTFLDATAEAMIAHRLRDAGATVRFEVPTPSGRAADFIVDLDDVQFCLHIKRAETRRPHTRRLTISSRLRMLERIKRPYIVSLRWDPTVRDAQMQKIVADAAEFIGRARVGDESVIRDDAGNEIGGVLIVAPSAGTHVQLTIGLPDGFIDETRRLRRLLSRGYRQFMPRMLNIIVIGTSGVEDLPSFESALLGAPVERWDRHPPHGRRIAHGRARDGFWTKASHADSRIAGWFLFAPDQPAFRSRLWYRSPGPTAVDEVVTRLLCTDGEPVPAARDDRDA